MLTRIGNRNELRPRILQPIPIHKESSESAIPRYIDSFKSM